MAMPPGFSGLIGVKVDGRIITFPEETPSCVKAVEDRTYVPIRILLENSFTTISSGPVADVYTFTCKIDDKNHKFTTKVAGSVITITHNDIAVDLKQFLFGGRVYIQLRALCELIQTYELVWDKQNSYAVMSKKVMAKLNPIPNDGIERGESKKVRENFQDQINDYTAKIWDDNKQDVTMDRKFEPFFYGDMLGDKTKLRKDGFDINIVYGGAVQTLIELNKYMNAKSQGDTDASKAFDQFKFNTVRAIRSVFIRSIGQEFDASGNPIYEIYEFVARDIE
jgi:hypothetical protein